MPKNSQGLSGEDQLYIRVKKQGGSKGAGGQSLVYPAPPTLHPQAFSKALNWPKAGLVMTLITPPRCRLASISAFAALGLLEVDVGPSAQGG